jgi:GT2 family glycosyltransferase
MFVEKTTLIIPTHNREKLLEKLLFHLKELKLNFLEIIVIDSSEKKIRNKIIKISKFFKTKLYFSKPSTSIQRNIGLKKANKKSKYIMFLDDDILFYKNSFLEMNKLIRLNKFDESISGFGFNMNKVNKKDFIESIKESNFIKKIGLYSEQPGKITKSGWQTKIKNIHKDTYVDWIYTAASVYKANKIKNLKFSRNLGTYSYLEDLEFCLKLKKIYPENKLLISKLARFRHPNDIQRTSFSFGFLEIKNRYLIVKKYKLNTKLFFLGSLIRMFISLINVIKGNLKYIQRTIGNFISIAICFFIEIFFFVFKFKSKMYTL